MEIRYPNESDWAAFAALAAAEGWRIPTVEQELFAGPWAGSARVAVSSGRFCGLVTAVAHDRSGWIGNLIVPAALRGRGFGAGLLRAARTELLNQGVTSIWLTASAQGEPLYAKEGFVAIDQIERWVATRRRLTAAGPEARTGAGSLLRDWDRSIWGEHRQSLLDALLAGSQAFACNDSVTLLQTGANLQVIGPWYSPEHCPRSNRILLQTLLAAADPALEIVVDTLASAPLRRLLASAMFERVGQTALMVYGDWQGVKLNEMAALASLGSIG